MKIATTKFLRHSLLPVVFGALAVKWYLRDIIGANEAHAIFLVISVGIIAIYLLYVLGIWACGDWVIRISIKHRIPRYWFHIIALVVLVMILVVGPVLSIGLTEFHKPLPMIARSITMLVITALCVIAAVSYSRNDENDKLWDSLSVALGLYVAINLVGGVVVNSEGMYELAAGLINNGETRNLGATVVFPFSPNLRAFAIDSGMLTVLAFRCLIATQLKIIRWMQLVFLATGVVGVALGDSRSVLAACVALIGYYLIWRKMPVSILFMFFIFVIVVPWITVYGALESVVQLGENILYDITRRGDLSELATLNNREIIWRVIITEIGRNDDNYLFGNGFFGHIITNAYLIYGMDWPEPELITAHNTILQYGIDYGYFGMTVIILVIFLTIYNLRDKQISKRKRRANKEDCSVILLVYILFVSIFEVTIYYTSLSTYVVFFLISICSLTHSESKRMLINEIDRGVSYVKR